MTTRLRFLPIMIVVLGYVALSSVPVGAQEESGIRRRPVAKQDLSIPSRQAVLTEVQFAPGAQETEHTHPGDLFVYGEDGTLTFHIAGMADTLLKPGESVFIPAEKVHWAQNAGDAPAKALTVLIAEKGKPLRSPANK